MKFSILLALALSYTTLTSAQNFRKDNADKAEQLTEEFAKLTRDSPCENNAQACVENQFAQCVNGKFQLNSCGGGELKCVVLPLVNKAGTSITCSTEADRLARLADARGEKPPSNQVPDQGKVPDQVKVPDQEKGKGKGGKGKDSDVPPGEGKDGKAPGEGKDGKAPGDGKDGKPPGEGKDGKAPGDGKDGKAPDEGKDGKPPGEGKDGKPPGEEDGKPPGEEDGKAPGEEDGKAPGEGKDGKAPDEGKDGKAPGEEDGKEPGEGKDGKAPGEGKDGKAPQDNLKSPPANGDGNLAEIRKQNAADAEALQEKFSKLKPDDECNDNDVAVACVDNKFAQCSGGKFALTDCASGTVCAALPLVLKRGTTVACTTEADRDARLEEAKNSTKK